MNAFTPIEQQFSAALAAHGFVPKEIIGDGEIQRFAGPGDKPGKKSGFYVLHIGPISGGAFGDWRTGFKSSWCSRDVKTFTQSERAEWRKQRAIQRAAVDAERKRLQGVAAKKAAAIWRDALDATPQNPYCVRKGVEPFGLKEFRDKHTLIVPIRTSAGALVSLQFIYEDGSKRFLTGGEKSGCYFSFGGAPADRLLIVEGFATGASLHAATGLPVAVAFDAGGLPAVAARLRDKLPACRLILCADDDAATAGNPGITKATEAARLVGGVLAVPDFGEDRPEGATDFNDLHQARGLDVVRACIEAASDVQPAEEATAQPEAPKLPALDERPCWRVYEAWGHANGGRVKPGVYWHGLKPGRNDGPPTLVDKWICTPMTVKAVTRNREDAEYGRLLEILSPAGKQKKWAMPMSMLAGDGNEARGVLLGEGLVFDLNDKGGILRYIAGQFPKETMRAASVTGWHDDAFVLPDTVIGADDIWFQASGRTAPYSSAGTFEGWRELAELATDNPLLMLALSAGFAGPLLGPLNLDGGGVHLYGDSSSGKTTALLAAISVWGGPAFKRTWRATANGLEGAGSLHSDTLLALDELGEIEPKSLYESAYALINGMGKTRANRHGEARQATRWRVFLLSTGELTIAARINAGGFEAKAGQELRILDVPVAGVYGLFDDLRCRPSGGVLSDDVRNLSAKHYGHAGPRFVAELVQQLRSGMRLADQLQPLVEQFGASEGQERRAARTFAVCALAGELAINWNVAPWFQGDPTKAAIHGFTLWRDRRGTNGQGAEHAAILRAVADFIDKYGAGRFAPLETAGDPIRDRAGYWKERDAGRLYLFTSGGLREATKGFDLSRVTAALDKAGALDGEARRHTKTTRTPDGNRAKLYHVNPDKLIGAD